MSLREHFIAAIIGAGCAALLVIRPGAQTAAPSVISITGNLADGGIVTVQGSGFGPKPTPSPLKYDDFENGTIGQEIGNGWDLISSTPVGYNPIYSTRRLRANSRVSAEARFINSGYLSSFGINRGSTPLTRIYFDAWYYLDAVAPYMRNTKPIRIHTDGEGQPNMYMGMWCSASTSSVLDQDGVTGTATTLWSTLTTSYYAQNWRHIQGWVEESSPNIADGTAQIWVDGALQFNRVHGLLNRNTTATWNTIWFGNYLGHDTNPAQPDCGTYGDAWTLWDDVYVDTTPARVEIGDAPTYAQSRHREIQLPSAWSDTSISAKLNLGSFPNLAGVYLFVIDASGNPSPGYLMAGRPPGTPTNLRIIR